MLKINMVNMAPNPVEAGSEFLLQINIITWDSLKAKHTWDSLNGSGETWKTLRDKAVDMDFSEPNWNEARERYRTWNSMKRYGMTWDELKGDS